MLSTMAAFIIAKRSSHDNLLSVDIDVKRWHVYQVAYGIGDDTAVKIFTLTNPTRWFY